METNEHRDQFDNPDDLYGRIYRKIDNIYQTNKTYLKSINLLLLVLVILEVIRFFH